MPSFSDKKQLKFIITVNADKVVLTGFRASVDVDKAAGMIAGTLRAKIYGVRESDMHSITTLALQSAKYAEMQWQPNQIDVFAVEGATETLVFQGNIVNAWADYAGMPDVFLNIHAQAAYRYSIAPATPKSYNGTIDVATVMAILANDMGLKFERNDVSVPLSNVYLANTALEQAKTLANAAGITMVIDDDVLAICYTNHSRKTPEPPLISLGTGLVGYPTIDVAGVTMQCLFDPAIRFMHQFQLVSDQVRASGLWVATCVSLRLDSEKPGGGWFMVVRGNFDGTPYVGR